MPDAVPVLSPRLSAADVLKRWSLRWGIGRSSSAVEPGLYRLGNPDRNAPVLVTCNYRMTVDIVRRDTAGVDAWLLVLDTFGVNVWCAAGKSTFGTDELVKRIYAAHLADYVDHSMVVLPQLGAPGIAAHTVRELTGFRVVYGPVRARDVRAFLDAGMKATAEMRAVTFTLAERAVLAPVEVLGAMRFAWAVPVYIALAVLGASIGARGFEPRAALTSMFPAVLGFLLGALGGGLFTPLLLPWLPGRAFGVKGAVAGVGLAAAVLALMPGMLGLGSAWGWAAVLAGAGAFASYVGLNFTGSTPYTSPSGVERELRRALPWQAAALIVSLVCWTIAWFIDAGMAGG